MTVGVIVLLGPPGSGKGTQAKMLAAQNLGWIQVSTGDLFRAEIGSKSPLGLQVQDIIAKGNLVSDDLTNNVFESQVIKILDEKSPKVLLLDGYPRNKAQSLALLNFVKSKEVKGRMAKPLVIEFKIDQDVIVKRLSDRLINPRSGKIYHRVTNPPKKAGICDDDGGPLIQRPDDKPETIRDRFKIYADSRDQIVEGLGGKSQIFAAIDADRKPEIVQNELVSAIKKGL